MSTTRNLKRRARTTHSTSVNQLLTHALRDEASIVAQPAAVPAGGNVGVHPEVYACWQRIMLAARENRNERLRDKPD